MTQTQEHDLFVQTIKRLDRATIKRIAREKEDALLGKGVKH